MNERDIPRFDKETLIRRWMNIEERKGYAFSDKVTDLSVMADVVMRLYVETGHRQQDTMMFK